MKEIFKKVIKINMMEETSTKEECARDLSDTLNFMELPQYFNWASDIFEDLHVKKNPDKKALIWSDLDTLETKTFSYKLLSQKANQLINLSLKSGVEKGDNFYMMTPILPENWFASLTCIKAGIINVPTPTTMTQRALKFRFETYTPNVIMADEESAALIDKTLEEINIVPKLKLVIGEKQGWVSFDMIKNESKKADKADTKPDDILFCFFTSGTTGLPKRVGHTAVSYPVGHLSTTIMTNLKPDDIHNNLSASGWSKWSWSSFFAPFNVGATTTGFKFSLLDGEQYLDAVASHKITSFCAPPTAWKMFVNMNIDSFDFPCLKQAISAGEPLNANIIRKWEQYTSIQIRDYYGQTESTAMIGNPSWMENKIRPGSFGLPSFMYDMALADNEGNEITEPDKTGHVVVKLDKYRPIGLFAEYIGSPEKMSSVFVDHYYYTGDRASFDKDGYWWFVGRADDVIKSSDYRIGPFEVESALMEHPAVTEVAVIGAPDPNRYQLVKAYIILNPAYKPSRKLALELFKHTITILPKFKIPRILEFVPDVPKTISGKIRRVELRQIEIAKQNQSSDQAPDQTPDQTTDQTTGQTTGQTTDQELQEYFYWDFPELRSCY